MFKNQPGIISPPVGITTYNLGHFFIVLDFILFGNDNVLFTDVLRGRGDIAVVIGAVNDSYGYFGCDYLHFHPFF